MGTNDRGTGRPIVGLLTAEGGGRGRWIKVGNGSEKV